MIIVPAHAGLSQSRDGAFSAQVHGIPLQENLTEGSSARTTLA
jgi:hypothetical protein